MLLLYNNNCGSFRKETALKCATNGGSKEVDLATISVAFRTGDPKGGKYPFESKCIDEYNKLILFHEDD